MESVLTKEQVKTFRKSYVESGEEYVLIAKVRYDDECGNGYNTFKITGEIWRAKHGQPTGRCVACGCIHDDIAKHLPQLAPYIKWHLVSSDMPMHYIANTVYHVQSYGPRYAWIYYTGPQDPLGIEGSKERLIGYVKADKARRCEGQPGYQVVWDERQSKVANLDYARSSAVWPDATDEDLLAPGLEDRLRARLPRVMEEFKAAVESLGFVY